MKISLKTLKEGKTQKKDYKFLTSAEDLINKEYKEILSDFTFENYSEAITELEKDNIGFAAYVSPSVLKFSNSLTSLISPKKKEEISFKTLEISLASPVMAPKCILERENYRWRSSYKIKLSELFVITDLDEFEKFIKVHTTEITENKVETLKKNQVKDDKDTTEEVNRIKKYGQDYKNNSYSNIVVTLLEGLEETDNKDKFKKVNDAISEIVYNTESRNNW